MAGHEPESHETNDSMGSISGYLVDAKLGESVALERLTDAYLDRLERFANSRMSKTSKQVEDEQDVAIRVLNEFFSGCIRGKFGGLKNRKQLWRLLAKMTIRRVFDHCTKYHADKRDVSKTENIGSSGKDSTDKYTPELVSLAEIDPQLAVGLKETYERVIASIQNAKQRKIIQLYLEGYTTRQIALRSFTGSRNVRKRLAEFEERLISDMATGMRENTE